MVDRNPSPPPEFEKDWEIYRADSVGETAISKHWVLTTLMSIVSEVEGQIDKEENSVDVGDEIQDAACKLWDICMDPEVAEFLLGCCDILKILVGVIIKSKSPRITEISVGILGNIACSKKSCRKISRLDELRTTIVALLSTSDTQTLIEVVRLIKISLSNTDSSECWLATILESEEFLQNSIFILKSSTNSILLLTTSELIDLCLDLSSTLLEAVATKEFVNCLIECVEQLIKNKTEDRSFKKICHSLHAIYTISSLEKGKSVLRELVNEVIAMFARLCYKWMTSSLQTGKEKEMSSDEVSVSSLLSVVAEIFSKKEGVKVEKENELHVDEEDIQLLIQFCKSIIVAKGDLSCLKKVPVLVLSSKINEDQNEFRTPLLSLKNSPHFIRSPALINSPKINSGSVDGTPTSNTFCSQNSPTSTNNTTKDKGNSESSREILLELASVVLNIESLKG